ncbi:hypothetical protein F511_03876 [Dorcoceras hygrometricum]|nr:hypothetical protein F511_03876 [Dorcoceras hygrometricum]
MGNADPNNTKAGKQIRDQASVRRAIKQLIRRASPSSIHNKNRLGLKETGIDQLELHSIQLGYLKILQMGNADPNNTKAGKQIRDQASNSNPVLPLNKVTVHTKLRTVGISYPEAETNGRTIKFHYTKKQATSRSSPRSFYSLNWVKIGRATHKVSSATKFTQNNDGKRRQSTEKSHASKPTQRLDEPRNRSLATGARTLRFNLRKLRRVAPTTGSSNQQLVTQLEQFLTTQQLIALQFSSQHQNIDQHVSLSRSFSQLHACCQQQPHQAQLLLADSFFKRNY